MREYQFFEFRAVDRPLTDVEMRELRVISTRAEITPTSFQNFYTFGDFKGDPDALMRRYFDAFVYIRWETRTLAVPLAQLEGIDLEEEAARAIEDWHYWVDQGYEL
jgi:hypothetical protein